MNCKNKSHYDALLCSQMLFAQIDQASVMYYRTFPSTYHKAYNKIFALHGKPKLCGRTGKLSPTSKAAIRKRGR